MRGIETAFWGTLGKAPELKTSKIGNSFATMTVAVTVGQSDDGRGATQWVRVASFGDTARNIASRAKKDDRVYYEGSLALNQWNDAHGETRNGLNVSAWKN
jgi:single-stranded DNA-binding protein